MINPMCPFAQRCLYVLSFKRAAVKVRNVDLSDKPSWFLEENPSKYLPALLVWNNGTKVIIHESIIISQFLDALPGISIYPKGECFLTNAAQKAVIDMKVATDVEPLRRAVRMAYWKSQPNDREVLSFKRIVKNVNDMVLNGCYFEFQIFGRDVLGFIDLMALPLIERIIAFKDLGLKYYENLRLDDLLKWYSRISQIHFIKAHSMPLTRYINLRKQMQLNKYRGLVLPAEAYDVEAKL
jgi:glutathione S-transferase